MKQLTLGLLLSLPFLLNTAHAKHFNLGEHNETAKNAIAFIDGHFGRISGNTIGIMIQVAQKINLIQHGEHDAQNRKVRVGNYTFKGKRYSFAELAQIEHRYVGDPELNMLLVTAKKDFEELVSQFIDQASGTKDFLIILIQESCNRRDRKNSLLLTWAQAPEAHETLVFHTEIQSFEALNNFCQDLTNFLGDLIGSCPKAFEQFQAMKKAYAQDHNA